MLTISAPNQILDVVGYKQLSCIVDVVDKDGIGCPFAYQQVGFNPAYGFFERFTEQPGVMAGDDVRVWGKNVGEQSQVESDSGLRRDAGGNGDGIHAGLFEDAVAFGIG